MSLVLQSSGGGQITIQEPATASNFTQNLPAVNGTVLTTGNISGFVLQVVQGSTSTQTTTTSQTYSDTTLTASITPTSATSKILVMVTLSGSGNSGAAGMLLRLVRNSTPIYLGDSAGSRIQATTSNITSDNNVAQAIAFTFLDLPATTSATTYKVQICSSFGSNPVVINRSITDVDASDRARTASSITVMEIAA